MDEAPIAPHFATTKLHDPSSKCQIKVFFASRVLSATDGISRLLLQISVFIADLRKVSISEGIVVVKPCPHCLLQKPFLDWRVACSLEAIVVRRTRQRNTGSQCQLRMVVSQLSGPTIDDSDQILPVCCGPWKFTRSRQETNTSDTCPFSQFVADKTSTNIRNQKNGTVDNAVSCHLRDVK